MAPALKIERLAAAAQPADDGEDAEPTPAGRRDGTADEPQDATVHPYPHRVKAPDLAGGLAWINTSGPL
ncbi:MAG TPA: hypothetical protein VGX78_13525, partial [Pirellulales bacterium]|nr:hypothetical protein [Pirellulales bacterium]